MVPLKYLLDTHVPLTSGSGNYPTWCTESEMRLQNLAQTVGCRSSGYLTSSRCRGTLRVPRPTSCFPENISCCEFQSQDTSTSLWCQPTGRSSAIGFRCSGTNRQFAEVRRSLLVVRCAFFDPITNHESRLLVTPPDSREHQFQSMAPRGSPSGVESCLRHKPAKKSPRSGRQAFSNDPGFGNNPPIRSARP